MSAERSTSEPAEITATARSPLSVCLFISHFWPVTSGAENQAYQQGVELVRRGHTVHVLTRAVPGRARDEPRDGLLIHRWIQPWERGASFGASFIVQGARAVFKLRKQFQVLHTHQGLWEACAAGLARRWIGRPVLVQPAAGGWDGEVQVLARTRGRRVLRRLMLRNDHFAAISRQIAGELSGLGVPPDRLTFTASGVDTERFSPGPSSLEASLPPRPRMLFVGRLHAQKNLPVLFRAWRDVVMSAADAGERQPVLLLAGEGPEREALSRLCGALDITRSVRFLGAVENFVEYYRATDVFVLPSRAEGSPNALLEAMSVGLACAVSDIGGNTDLVCEGQTGVVLHPDDPALWAAALTDLLRDAGLRERLGASARPWIMSRRSLTGVVDQYESIYRNLLRPRRASSM